MNVLREFSARLNGTSVRDHILRIVLRIIRQQVVRNEEQIVDEDNKENIRPSKKSGDPVGTKRPINLVEFPFLATDKNF
ncbi:hypothetical protein L5515_009238 [Caenorhabditis briggsae]|uniref:Uncharacterized protein n=1 Tax=Caenorhabditis briggsae TaxID=6238 RepID=A0AAE9F9F1_CAEBR|nr:hypothetical protein L5515_009238 [Caenorhabditis briggsae]